MLNHPFFDKKVGSKAITNCTQTSRLGWSSLNTLTIDQHNPQSSFIKKKSLQTKRKWQTKMPNMKTVQRTMSFDNMVSQFVRISSNKIKTNPTT